MRGRRGFTLIETTVAIALVAVIVVTILSAFSAITLAARRHQQVTTLDRLTRSEAEYVKSQAYSTSGTYSTSPASGYTVTYQVLYYSAATNPPTFLSSNLDVGLQEIVLTVNGPNGATEVLDFLKEQP